MKKIITIMMLLGLVFSAVPEAKAVEIDPTKINGNPNDNPNHFVWDLMSQLQAPDDPDCATVASAELQSLGLTEEEAATPASMACSNLNEMKSNMQSGMDGESEGSTETNLFDAANWHNVENLYFQHSTNGIADGRIAFSAPIDFMSYNFMTFMMSFGQNMESSQSKIALDADVVGGFANYGATLTMYNIPDFEDPKILVDGGEDEEGVVSNLAYDRETHTLTFSAAHFTEFEAVEGSSSSKKPKISKVDIIKTKMNGKTVVAITVKGDHFNRHTKMKLSGKKAFKKSLKSDEKIVGYFYLDDLKKIKRAGLRLKLSNPNDKVKKYKGLIYLSQI